MNTRLCIFCGKEPSNKTDEHVLPHWLIKLTGEPKRQALVSLRHDPQKRISFDKLQFPACDDCNLRYGDELERPTSIVVRKMLRREPISAREVSYLLDWVDKIRVGIWLGYHVLEDKRYYDFEPHFYINDRVGQRDHLLFVSATAKGGHGLQWHPPEDVLFATTPCFFWLRINSLFIISLSYNTIVSEALELPFFEKVGEGRGGRYRFELKPLPSNSLRLPDFGRKYRVLAQIIYPRKLEAVEVGRLGLKHILNNDRRSSRILEVTPGRVAVYPVAPSLNWLPKLTPSAKLLLENGVSDTITLRRWLYDNKIEQIAKARPDKGWFQALEQENSNFERKKRNLHNLLR